MAGEISGLPAQLPPTVDPAFAITFSNDFLGSGGATDDFRTTQSIVSARLGERVDLIVDHSTLTLDSMAPGGRTDIAAVSLGYRLFDRREATTIQRLLVGSGLRASGNFSGERMQNGFHRLVGSDIVDQPYTSSRDTDLTAWLLGERVGRLHRGGEWEGHYWLRFGSVATSGGQWDNMLGAYYLLSKSSLEFWVGLRGDWRAGHDADAVQAATADEETDVSGVIGLRFGALVLETVQQFDGDASYGQLKLVADGRAESPGSGSGRRFDIDFGFLLPDVELQLAARFKSAGDALTTGTWRRSLAVDLRYGEPQFEDDTNLYVRVRQLGAGIEWERTLAARHGLSAYGGVGGAWRIESLATESGTGIAVNDEAIGRFAATAGAGIRMHAARLRQRARFRLQLGLSAWLPTSSAEVAIDDRSVTLHKSGLALVTAINFAFE